MSDRHTSLRRATGPNHVRQSSLNPVTGAVLHDDCGSHKVSTLPAGPTLLSCDRPAKMHRSDKVYSDVLHVTCSVYGGRPHACHCSCMQYHCLVPEILHPPCLQKTTLMIRLQNIEKLRHTGDCDVKIHTIWCSLGAKRIKNRPIYPFWDT